VSPRGPAERISVMVSTLLGIEALGSSCGDVQAPATASATRPATAVNQAVKRKRRKRVDIRRKIQAAEHVGQPTVLA
jgi:hypothetical protein